MKSPKRTITSVLATVGFLTVCVRAWAQSSPTPSVPTPAVPTNGGRCATAIAAIVVVVGLLAVIGLAVKLFDLKRKRESEAVQLQAQVSDALLRDPMLAGLALTATARIPMWRATPTTIQVTGQVPTREVKDAALDLVRREATGIRPDVRVEDRISVGSTMPRAA